MVADRISGDPPDFSSVGSSEISTRARSRVVSSVFATIEDAPMLAQKLK